MASIALLLVCPKLDKTIEAKIARGTIIINAIPTPMSHLLTIIFNSPEDSLNLKYKTVKKVIENNDIKKEIITYTIPKKMLEPTIRTMLEPTIRTIRLNKKTGTNKTNIKPM